MKDLFSGDGKENYSELARQIDDEAYAAISPIFDRYVGLGYSIRQIQYITQMAVMDIALNNLLMKK